MRDTIRAAAGWARDRAARSGLAQRLDSRAGSPSGASLELGWLVDAEKAEFIYEAPVPATRHLGPGGTGHPKAMARCPSVLDIHRRLWVVPCPFDIHLRIDVGAGRTPQILNAGAVRATMNPGELKRLLFTMPPERWRSPDRPLIQIATPYRFVADDPAWITQLPPFLDHEPAAWPGALVPGRFPIHVWPRMLSWAFEWRDTDAELRIERGDPWFMVQLEGADPAQSPRLRRARMTPELRDYCRGLDGVTTMVSGTSRLFEVAAERRPERLFVPAED